MLCKQIAKQTKGEITEIKLDAKLNCNVAQDCRRKGICVLSPFSGMLNGEELFEPVPEQLPADESSYPSYYEVLRFKNALGFQWMRVRNFAEAIRFFRKQSQEDQLRLIRRVEYFQIPE
jgi:hypothetical protein